nr:MAG TPA: hypothetical protein [Caudoviricetes sp.]
MDANLKRIKFILREDEMPMFTDESIKEFIQNSVSVESALYELLLLKSENTALNISGLTTAETSDYFRRLASTYRPFNTGTLGGN